MTGGFLHARAYVSAQSDLERAQEEARLLAAKALPLRADLAKCAGRDTAQDAPCSLRLRCTRYLRAAAPGQVWSEMPGGKGCPGYDPLPLIAAQTALTRAPGRSY